MLRVAYLLNIFPKLSETFIVGELGELHRRGTEVRILSLLPPREEPRHDLVHRAGLDSVTSYEVADFPEIIREFRPDLLHAHFAREATEKARELSNLTGVPFSFTAHGYDIHRKPPPDFYERAMAAVALITVSESNATYIQNTFGVPRSHLRVIPCGVDTELFRPIAKKEEKNADPIVLCVARHVEVKNLALLLDACALLRDRGIGFRCVMLGDGPLRCTLKAQCARLCLEKVVEFPGAADQAVVLKAWQAATVGVLTSHNEGMPLSLMEAAACGVPVVATAVGGIPELVSDSITGLLVSPGNAIELSSALERLLTNHELRSGMGQAARELASRKFSVTRQIDSLLKVWSQVLGGAAYECHR